MTDLLPGSAALRDLENASALAEWCPTCGNPPKRHCTSVRGPWRGRRKAWPHPSRIRRAL